MRDSVGNVRTHHSLTNTRNSRNVVLGPDANPKLGNFQIPGLLGDRLNVCRLEDWLRLWGGGQVVGGELALRLVLFRVEVGGVWGVRAGSLALGVSQVFLGLGAVLVHGVGNGLTHAASVLGSEIAHLGGLLVDDVTSVFQVTIDDLAVLDVDQRDKVDD